MYTLLPCMFFFSITAVYVAACVFMLLPDSWRSWDRLRRPCRRSFRRSRYHRSPFQFRLQSVLLGISALAAALTIARSSVLENPMPGFLQVVLYWLILVGLALLMRMIVTDIFGDRSGALAARRQNRVVERPIELPDLSSPAAADSPANENAFDRKRREHKKWWNRVWPNRYRPYGSGRGYHVPESR